MLMAKGVVMKSANEARSVEVPGEAKVTIELNLVMPPDGNWWVAMANNKVAVAMYAVGTLVPEEATSNVGLMGTGLRDDLSSVKTQDPGAAYNC